MNKIIANKLRSKRKQKLFIPHHKLKNLTAENIAKLRNVRYEEDGNGRTYMLNDPHYMPNLIVSVRL